MSCMEKLKAVRLRLPETIANLKFKNEKYDCDDDLSDYMERREFNDLVAWKEIGKFRLSYGCNLVREELRYIHEDYIDFLLDVDYNCYDEFVKSRKLNENELNKYIPKFSDFFDKVKLPKPEISTNTSGVVEYCYYTGCDAPCCFDETTDPFYDEI